MIELFIDFHVYLAVISSAVFDDTENPIGKVGSGGELPSAARFCMENVEAKPFEDADGLVWVVEEEGVGKQKPSAQREDPG